jgi:hypothetical protein
MVKFTDERVKTVNEAIQGIRCVKMYTWEGEHLVQHSDSEICDPTQWQQNF